jgi:hypothetical protein
MTENTIEAKPLQLGQWQEQLEDLAAAAEQLGQDCSLENRLAVSSEWFRLLWLSCDPAWIAQSCRLASRLCEPVMAMPAGVDQQVLSSWDARRSALKSVGALKELGPGPVADPSLIGKAVGRPPRRKPEPEHAVAPEPERVSIRDRIKAEPVAPRVLRPRSERMGTRPAPPAPEPPAEPEQAPVPAGWDCEPEQVAPEPAPAPEQHGWGGEIVAPDPAPATISALELASWWGLSVSWVHSLHRRGVLQLGTHYRKHQRGEPKGNRYFPGPTYQAIAAATDRPIPHAPLQTVEECRQPRRQRRVLAEQMLAKLQQQPDSKPEAAPEVPPDVLASSNGHREPVTSCWAGCVGKRAPAFFLGDHSTAALPNWEVD